MRAFPAPPADRTAPADLAASAARLHRPRVQAMPRERLLRFPGTTRPRVTLLTGPAGSGKTTLLVQLLGEEPGSAAWYRPSTQDTSEAALVHYLGHALGAALPDLADACRMAADVGELASVLFGAGHDTAVVLAVDDLHHLHGTPAEAALERFLDLAPDWLQLLATCRQPPRWNLSRLRVSGELHELGPDQLRFRSWEVERLFRDYYGEPLPPGDLVALARAVEGWAAGLQLFHVATSGKPASERRRALASLPVRSALIREYLARNVLGALPADLAGFLVDTCVLGRLTASLCDRVRGASDSAALLDELVARQVFVERNDEDRSYRCQPVLRASLEARLVERDGEAAARERFRVAGALLEEDGLVTEALAAFVHAEDWAAVSRVLGTSGPELAGDGGAWLDAVPASVIDDDPWLLVATARRAVATGRFTAALERYAQAQELADDRASAVCHREAAAVAMWSGRVAAPLLQGWPGRVRLAVCGRLPDPSPEATGRVDRSGAGDRFGAAVVDLLAGRVAMAARALELLAEDPDADAALSTAAHLVLAVAAAARPDVVPPVDLDDLVEHAELSGIPWLGWLARAALALSGRPEAAAGARDVAAGLERQGDDWGTVLCHLMVVVGQLARGHDPGPEADALVARLEELDAGAVAAWCAALRPSSARIGDVARPAPEHPFDDEPPATAAGLPRRLGPPPERPAVPGLAVRCFGGFGIELAGEPVDLSALKPKVRSTLRMLAAHGDQAVHHETLVDALWPDASARSGKHNLQVAVSALRRWFTAVAPGAGDARDIVRREGTSYRLVLPEDSTSDVGRFNTAIVALRLAEVRGDADATAAAARQALAAYAGDLLPEEGPTDWAVTLRDRLRGEAAAVALALADHALASGDPGEACAACYRGLEIDRYDDGLWRRLLAAHDAGGDLAAADRSRRRYRQVLDELGIPSSSP